MRKRVLLIVLLVIAVLSASFVIVSVKQTRKETLKAYESVIFSDDGVPINEVADALVSSGDICEEAVETLQSEEKFLSPREGFESHVAETEKLMIYSAQLVDFPNETERFYLDGYFSEMAIVGTTCNLYTMLKDNSVDTMREVAENCRDIALDWISLSTKNSFIYFADKENNHILTVAFQFGQWSAHWQSEEFQEQYKDIESIFENCTFVVEKSSTPSNE